MRISDWSSDVCSSDLGVAVVDGDRVLVKDQTSGVENGIYVVRATAWERARDFDGARDTVQGTRVFIVSGALGAGKEAKVTTADPIVIGTTSLAFTLIDDDTASVAADLAAHTTALDNPHAVSAADVGAEPISPDASPQATTTTNGTSTKT